jgi:hypothetical protein
LTKKLSNRRLEKLYNKNFYNSNIVSVIKYRRVSWMEYVALMEEIRNV